MDPIRSALQPPADPAWRLDESVYAPRYEAAAESRFSIGNGFLGVRGSREVSRGPTWVSWMHHFNWTSWPRTYVAGVFDTPNFTPPVPALVPAADWLRVRIHLDGAPLRLDAGQLLEHRRSLDFRRGLLLTDWRQRTAGGAMVRVQTLRLVSQADRATGLQLLLLELDGGTPEITLDASFDLAVTGLEQLRISDSLGLWRTEQSGLQLAMAGAATVQTGGAPLEPVARGPLAWSWRWQARAGEAAVLHRAIGVARSDAPAAAADAALARAISLGWRAALAAHEAAWADRWQDSDIEIGGDPAATQALRFAVYHMVSAANPDDERVSVGARALTGDSYLGHVFWDTEIYLLPFYTVAWPEAARAMLMYRYHTLQGARAKAKYMGYQGAMYAWESADTGEETTPEQVLDPAGRPVDVLCGKLEQHITADVAYAVWHYWRISGDDVFLRDAGAEILLDTARFWASRAQPEADWLRHIRNVIGPDEYHEGIDDNIYTNRLARWALHRAADTAAWLQNQWPAQWETLAARLGLDAASCAAWRGVADLIAPGIARADGVLEQFEGYFAREDIDLSHYAGRGASMDMVLGRARITQSQLLKQADVVALLGLLPEEFSAEAARTNYTHYLARCTHDSSLSRPMHALVAARLGDTEIALRYFHETAATDLGDPPEAAAAGGVRMAALGGLWQAAILGFAGVTFGEDGIGVAPHLPATWQDMRFCLQWRGRRVRIAISAADASVSATLETGAPMLVRAAGQTVQLQPGATATLPSGDAARG